MSAGTEVVFFPVSPRAFTYDNVQIVVADLDRDQLAGVIQLIVHAHQTARPSELNTRYRKLTEIHILEGKGSKFDEMMLRALVDDYANMWWKTKVSTRRSVGDDLMAVVTKNRKSLLKPEPFASVEVSDDTYDNLSVATVAGGGLRLEEKTATNCDKLQETVDELKENIKNMRALLVRCSEPSNAGKGECETSQLLVTYPDAQ